MKGERLEVKGKKKSQKEEERPKMVALQENAKRNDYSSSFLAAFLVVFLAGFSSASRVTVVPVEAGKTLDGKGPELRGHQMGPLPSGSLSATPCYSCSFLSAYPLPHVSPMYNRTNEYAFLIAISLNHLERQFVAHSPSQ